MSKRTAILFLLVAIPLLSLAQQKPKFVYCDVIVGATNISSGSVTITVDFGQKMKFWDNRMKNAEGKPVRFNSLVDALNYMGKKGWEFVQSYPVQFNSTSVDHHFLMKKPFDELEDDAKKEYLKDWPCSVSLPLPHVLPLTLYPHILIWHHPHINFAPAPY